MTHGLQGGLRKRDASAKYPLTLLGILAVAVVISGINAWYPQDWLLENLLVFVSIAVFAYTYRRFRLSDTSYTLLLVFFLLHEIGAHHTYAEVPYAAWLEGLGIDVAQQMGWERNHYDRLIHFAYGLLITRPAIELLRHVATPIGVWRHLLPVLFILSHSALYELIEWAAALVFGGDLGIAYLGTQGDEWDSQKDMACAALGAVIAVTAAQLVGSRKARSVASPAG